MRHILLKCMGVGQTFYPTMHKQCGRIKMQIPRLSPSPYVGKQIVFRDSGFNFQVQQQSPTYVYKHTLHIIHTLLVFLPVTALVSMYSNPWRLASCWINTEKHKTVQFMYEGLHLEECQICFYPNLISTFNEKLRPNVFVCTAKWDGENRSIWYSILGISTLGSHKARSEEMKWEWRNRKWCSKSSCDWLGKGHRQSVVLFHCTHWFSYCLHPGPGPLHKAHTLSLPPARPLALICYTIYRYIACSGFRLYRIYIYCSITIWGYHAYHFWCPSSILDRM